jgi:hypothetical protein
MGMLFTGGMELRPGMLMSVAPPPAVWATIDQASAASQLTIVGNQVTVGTSLLGAVGLSRTNGAKNVMTAASYSFEVVINDATGTPATNPYFYAGVIGTQNFTNNNYPITTPTNLASGYGFGPGLVGPPPVPRLWSFDGGAQGFFSPSIYVANGGVLGITIDTNTNTFGSLNQRFYYNGTLISGPDPYAFGSVPGGLISILIGYRFTETGTSVTLRTDPSTFSYGGSYSNQNGWPA